jgi:uncharacterized protein YjiS (DUF1127 family)
MNVNPTAGYPHWRSPTQSGSTYRSRISSGSTAIAGPIVAVLRLVRQWRRRARDRALLAQFDSRMLRDLGITRADVVREINRPFWRE